MKQSTKRAPKTVAAAKRPPAPRSYGLNEPDNYTVEEWPQSKRDLYESARLLFWDKGFADTSVQEIVEGAKLTKGAFYHYFGAKEDLLRVMYERSLERLFKVTSTTITDDMPSHLAIAAFVEEMVKVVIDYRVEVALFWEEYRRLPPELIPNNRERRGELFRFIVKLMNRGMERGELVHMESPTVAAMTLLGMCQFTHHWYQPGGKMTPAEVGKFFADMILLGLETPGARRGA
ncbi:MAG: transcriptional regulator, TetR family [Caulobacter sp.]|nr:transcriptional regulator, TetR family [Caulobacter sp.]